MGCCQSNAPGVHQGRYRNNKGAKVEKARKKVSYPDVLKRGRRDPNLEKQFKDVKIEITRNPRVMSPTDASSMSENTDKSDRHLHGHGHKYVPEEQATTSSSNCYDISTLTVKVAYQPLVKDLISYDLSVFNLTNPMQPLWMVRRTDASLCHCFRKLTLMDPYKHPLPEVPTDPWASIFWLSDSEAADTSAVYAKRAEMFEQLFASVLCDSWLMHHDDFSTILEVPEVAPFPRTVSLRHTLTNATTAPATPMTSMMLDRWEKVGPPLGRGCFGTVYLGQLENAEQVAVKVVDLATVASSDAQQAFTAEFAVMEKLQHPNIVQYLGHKFDTSGQHLLIFLELCTGGTVAELIQKVESKRLRPSVIRTYTRQVLLGLEYLHTLEKPVVHRDIKGANLLVTREGCIKLADFGCSKMLNDFQGRQAGMSTMVGTPYWMAPEVIAPQQGTYGTQCDIWSLGCTIVEMLGNIPWAGVGKDSPWEIMYHIANTTEPPARPTGVSPALQSVLDLCFVRTPQERPSATQLLRHPYFTQTDEPYGP